MRDPEQSRTCGTRALRSWLVLCALLAPARPLLAERLPLDYFTRHDNIGEVKISPDGTYLAASRYEDGEGHITVSTIEPLKAAYAFRTAPGTEIEDFYWASPTRLIYTIAQRHRGVMQPMPTGEIFAVDRDGRNPATLYGFRTRQSDPHAVDTRLPGTVESYASAEVIKELSDEQGRIIICERPWTLKASGAYGDPDNWPTLSMLDIFSGKTSPIDKLPLGNASPLLDNDNRPRFAVGYDLQGEVAVAWKPEDEWVSFELPEFRSRSITPRRFTPDNRAVVFTGTRANEPLMALYRLDLGTRAVDTLYADQRVDVDEVITDLAGENVIGVRVYADRPEYHWLQPENATAKLYQMLERAFPGQAVRLTSVSKDQRRAIAWVYSDVNPGDSYLIDTQSRKATFLIAGRSWVDPAKMRHKEPIEIKARDGLVLHGYLTRPRDGAGPYPLVVLPHGGPHAVRDYWGYNWEVQLLANYGYAVLQVNFRGSGGYGRDFERAGYREWGARMQDDITDATLWAIDQKVTSRDNICIYGASYGGYAALMGAVREPDLYQCAASDGGVTDLELMFHRGDTHQNQVGATYLEDTLGTDTDSLHARSPVYNADRIKVPVLLLHGKEDWRVDYAHATRMRDAMTKAGKQVELVSFGREGHGAFDEENRQQVYAKLLDFLAQHLHGGQAYSSN